MLSRCTAFYYQWTTYESLAEGVLKKPYYRNMVEISLLLFCCGCAVAYMIAVGDILEQAGFLIAGSRSWSMILVWCIAMMPLSMLHHMNSLAGVSAVGVTAIWTLVLATAIHAVTTPHPLATKWADFWFPAQGWILVLTACPVPFLVKPMCRRFTTNCPWQVRRPRVLPVIMSKKNKNKP
jgi:amino acid permease